MNAVLVGLTSVLLASAPGIKSNDLVGMWEGDGFKVRFDASGKGGLSDGPYVPLEPISWKVKGNKLLLTQDGETVGYKLSLKGNVLTVSGGDLDETIRLKKTGAGKAAKKSSDDGDDEEAAPAPAKTKTAKGAKGTCDGACKRYLGCVGASGRDAKNACMAECKGAGHTPETLAAFTASDCATVIAITHGGGQGGGSQPAANKPSKKECEGCVRDGNDCVWLSQGNWGTGYASPYSGAAAGCDPACCGL